MSIGREVTETAYKYSKFGYGDKDDIEQAISTGKLDGKDMVITKDTHELVYITDDKEAQVIRSRPLIFESEDDARQYVESRESTDVYLGQQVLIKGKDGKYDTYTIQKEHENYVFDPLVAAYAGIKWKPF